MAQEVIWAPQPGPQTSLITCPVFEVFFGGARGGGKTDASIGDWLAHSGKYGENAVGIFFRRNLTQLVEVIQRTKRLFSKIGAVFNAQHNFWTMANGARLKFAYLERDSDAQKYQGHSYTRVYIEEATNFPSEAPIKLLFGTLRSSVGVPCGMRLTGNPGGPGHQWVKRRYIDPDPRGYKLITETELIEVDGETREVSISRVFIPSKLSDNAMMMKADPGYVLRLRQTGSAALVKAWLTGDWDVVDGAYFTELSDANILPSSTIVKIPPGTRRFRSMDWGSATPFSVDWFAISDGTWGLPAGALYLYRQWYGSSGPNKGLKLRTKEVARGIKERQGHEIMSYGVADPSIFSQSGGPSIAQEMAISGVPWKRADNKRLPGWQQVRQRLVGDDGIPMLYLDESAVDIAEQLKSIQHDPTNTEDLDTKSEDHALDSLRYACMSRPWAPRRKILTPEDIARQGGGVLMKDLLEQAYQKEKTNARYN